MNRKRAFGLFIRIAVSVGMLFLLFAITPSFDRAELLPDWNVATPFWLVTALVLTFLGFFMATVRWYQVVHAVEIDEPIRRLFGHFLAGQFVSNFVLTTVGGDVVRVTRLGKDTGDPPASFASVVFERLFGGTWGLDQGLTDVDIVVTSVPERTTGAAPAPSGRLGNTAS